MKKLLQKFALYAFMVFSLHGFTQDLVITTQVCGNSGGSTVRLTGPWWGWNPTGGPVAADNGDGTYTFTLSPAPSADMEYLLVLDGVQENLISEMQNGGSCAPITDLSTYANRQWLTTDPLILNNVYGRCGSCPELNITTKVCGDAGGSTVRMTGPFWGWNPTGGPIAADNGDGTYTFTFDPPPATDMEYLILVDGVQEDLIAEMQNGGSCAPITDFATYANRQWLTSDTLDVSNTYNRCTSCPELSITTEVCGNSGGSTVRMTGPFWGWAPSGGPVANDNGDGTYTFTFDPPPTTDMEYLILVDGVQEDLISEMQNGGSCAPITDFSTYANRQWLTTDTLVLSNIYGQCRPCNSPCTPTSSTDTIIECDSLTWINGVTYTSSNNTATDTLMNAGGCDSIITLNLTINNSSSMMDTMVECGSTTINGTTYTSSQVVVDSFISSNNCDSIVTTDLTINPEYSITLDESINEGESYTFNGNNETIAGVYTASLTTADGCDSTITLNLTVIPDGGVGIEEEINNLSIYPNPSNGVLNIQADEVIENVVILDASGRILINESINNKTSILNLEELDKGIYFYELRNADGKISRGKIIKE